jgi:DNA protecting protein DprA
LRVFPFINNHMSGEILLGNATYPKLLSTITTPPARLYYKGGIETALSGHCLGVVGSRKITPYGEKAVRHILSYLSSYPITVVSGFMYGVDALAHELALDFGMSTVAVMPCGIDLIHPAHQVQLYERLLDSGGLILSELPGSVAPKRWYYPKRNRIVAGICVAVLVIEAAENSGSLITAGLARKYNRQVFSVPGSIFSKQSLGANSLFDSGALPVSSGVSIRDWLGFSPLGEQRELFNSSLGVSTSGEASKIPPLSPGIPEAFTDKILELLRATPMTINSLCSVVPISVSQMNTHIVRMVLEGHLVEKGGLYYVC